MFRWLQRRAENIAASRPAATFSARRLSQAPACGQDTGRYFSALIFSSMPFGHSFASSEARYTFCAWARKALTSGA